MSGLHKYSAELNLFQLDPEAGDQRTAARFTLLIRLAKLLVDDKEYLCVIRDASQAGMRLKLFKRIPTQSRIVIELANGERFPVRKIWERDGFGGFAFAEEVSLERLVETGHGPFPNHKLRLRTLLGGRLVVGGQDYPITFENLSVQGACITCEDLLAIDQLVRVETDELPAFHAKVRWRQRPQYGLVFEQMLSFEELGRFVEHQSD